MKAILLSLVVLASTNAFAENPKYEFDLQKKQKASQEAAERKAFCKANQEECDLEYDIDQLTAAREIVSAEKAELQRKKDLVCQFSRVVYGAHDSPAIHEVANREVKSCQASAAGVRKAQALAVEMAFKSMAEYELDGELKSLQTKLSIIRANKLKR